MIDFLVNFLVSRVSRWADLLGASKEALPQMYIDYIVENIFFAIVLLIFGAVVAKIPFAPNDLGKRWNKMVGWLFTALAVLPAAVLFLPLVYWLRNKPEQQRQGGHHS